MTRSVLTAITFALALIFMAFAIKEGFEQWHESSLIQSTTVETLSGAQGTDLVSKITAIRNYVLSHVNDAGFSSRNRPFFRDSAAETLQSGRGRCGEATRLFINMAAAAGISAHRLYLEGKKPHVVAVVVAEDGSKLIVDSLRQPYLPDVIPLESLKQNPMFTSYSTLGWRRLKVLRALPSNDVNFGPLNYILENPHALSALLWLLSAATLLGVTLLFRRNKLQQASRMTSEPKVGLVAGLSRSAKV